MPLFPASRRAAAAAAACGALLLSGCSSEDGPSSSSSPRTSRTVDVGDVLSDLADNVITPSYQGLGANLAALEADTAALCTSPSESSLEGAQAAWLDAVSAWQQTRASGVGPALDGRLVSDVAFAARPSVIALLLEGSDPVDVASLAEEGAAARGLYAAEEALFGEGSEVLATDTDTGARRCEYTASVATLAAQAAATVIDQWTSGAASDDLVAGLEGGPQSSVDALVNEASRRLGELDAMGLRDMAEASSIEELDASRTGGPADARLADRASLLAGISALVGTGSTGVSALVGAQDAATADRLVAAQAAADEAMSALPDSVADAFDDPEAIAAASDAVAKLKVLFTTEVASKLGVTINFSDSDGD